STLDQLYCGLALPIGSSIVGTKSGFGGCIHAATALNAHTCSRSACSCFASLSFIWRTNSSSLAESCSTAARRHNSCNSSSSIGLPFLLPCRPHDVCTLAPLRSYGENL